MNIPDHGALYKGRIRHRRYNNPDHRFSYAVWHVLLDIDRIDEICARIPWLSHNRINLLGFYDRDHMRPVPGSVRLKLNSWFEDRGIMAPDGRVLLLTGLRHLGFGFNPVTFYFCHNAKGKLKHVVAEVNSTFGETFCYLLDATGDHRTVLHTSPKHFHVSPFQPLEGFYDFRVTAPDDKLTVHIDLTRGGKRVFDATLSSRRHTLSSRSLLATCARHGHLSAMTLARIHWQAFKLWRKGAPFHSKPEMPKTAWRTHHG